MSKKCFSRITHIILIAFCYFFIFCHIVNADNSLDIPEKILTFSLSEKLVFPDPLYGVLYKYNNEENFPIDLYVYPVLDEVRQSDTSPADIEANLFIQSLEIMRARGSFDSAVVIQTEKTSHGKWDGQIVVMNIVQDGKDLRSLFYIFSEGNTFLKVRATYPRAKDLFSEVEGFISGLFNSILFEETETNPTLHRTPNSRRL